MSKLDTTFYAITRDNAAGPVIRMVDGDFATIDVARDAEGNPTRSGVIGYLIAYALLFSVVAYFILVV